MQHSMNRWISLVALALLAVAGRCGASAGPGSADAVADSGDLAGGDARSSDGPDAAGDARLDGADAAPPPRLTAVVPDRGAMAGGEFVELLGNGLWPVESVWFGTVAAPEVYPRTGGGLRVRTPAHDPGVVDVAVAFATGRGLTAPAAFEFLQTGTLTAVEPAFGPSAGGQSVTLRGTGLGAARAVVFGSRPALRLAPIDDTTLVAVTPPGAAGPVAVHVAVPQGCYTARGAYSYVDPLALASVRPAFGPSTGGGVVTLGGSGFAPDVRVWFGAAPAEILASPDATTLHVRTPPGPAGPVAVRLEAGAAAHVAESAFVYLDMPDGVAPAAPALHGVTPPTGRTAGGEPVTVLVTGLRSAERLRVQFGAARATLVEATLEAGSLRVLTPPGPAGPVAVRVTQGEASLRSDAAFRYVEPPTLASVEPATGPAAGGLPLTVRGSQLGAAQALYVGALPAAGLTVHDDQTLTASLPPGSPGPATLRVETPHGSALLADAFTYVAPGPDAFAIFPTSGSIAGGGLVHVYGAGLTGHEDVRVGGRHALSVARLSETDIVFRLPPGDIGVTDVEVAAATATFRFPAAFVYFDPTQTSGGTWGEPIFETVNVAVLDYYTSSPLGGAAVVLADPAGTLLARGYTNAAGLVTLSELGIAGPVTVSAAKLDHSSYTTASFDATNATLLLYKPPESGGETEPPSAPPSQVSGLIRYSDKQFFIPPAPCHDRGVAGTTLCLPCTLDADCGPTGRCVEWSLEGPLCALPCEAPGTPCGDGRQFACYALGPEALCLPSPGEARIQCTVSELDPLVPPTLPGLPGQPPAVLDDRYTLHTWPGEIAIACFGGAVDTVSFAFTPHWMGLRRHVNVPPNTDVADLDIDLDIPLDRSVTVTLDPPPPLDAAGPNRFRFWAYLELGAEGYIRLPGIPAAPAAGPVALDHLPRTLDGLLRGAHYTFVARAYTTNGLLDLGWPESVVLRSAVADPDDSRALVGDAAGNVRAVETHLPGPVRALTSAPDGTLWAAGVGGGLYRFTGLRPELQASPTTADLLGIAADASGRLVAVGAGGAVVASTGGPFRSVASDVRRDLVAVAPLPDGRFVAVGPRVVAYGHPDGGFSGTASPAELNAVTVDATGTVWAVGAHGTVLCDRGAGFTAVRAPTERPLHAVHHDPDLGLFAAGEAGVLLRYDGGTWQALPSPSTFDLYALTSAPGCVLAAGDAGEIVVIEAAGIRRLPPPPGYQVRLTAIAPLTDGRFLGLGDGALRLGPFVPFVDVTNPVPDGVLDGLTLRWTPGAGRVPDLQWLQLHSPWGGLLWFIFAAGDAGAVALPDFAASEGIHAMPGGGKWLLFQRIVRPGVSVERYSLEHLDPLTWRAWTSQVVSFD